MKDAKLDFPSQRMAMIQQQFILRGITDKRVLEVFSRVERHKFVPELIQNLSYNDCPLSIGHEQTISQPYMVALMTQSLALHGDERVLEIGTGSGYQTAILAELAKDVYSIERVPALGANALTRLKELGYQNINLKICDGTLGWDEFAPYDAIIVTAAAEVVPPPLLEQLKPGARLVVPLGNEMNQMLTRFTHTQAGIEREEICSCVFVPLIGKHGLVYR